MRIGNVLQGKSFQLEILRLRIYDGIAAEVVNGPDAMVK